MQTKKTAKKYSKPVLTEHGSIEKITLTNGHVYPADVPHGHVNTAFPLS